MQQQNQRETFRKANEDLLQFNEEQRKKQLEEEKKI